MGQSPKFSTTVEKTVENRPLVEHSLRRMQAYRVFRRGERLYGSYFQRLTDVTSAKNATFEQLFRGESPGSADFTGFGSRAA